MINTDKLKIIEIIIIPLSIGAASVFITFYLGEQQRISDEEQVKAQLGAQYTEIFINNLKDIDKPEIKQILEISANQMVSLGVPNAEQFQVLVGTKADIDKEFEKIQTIQGPDVESTAQALDYFKQDSISAEECETRKPGTMCIRFSDGFNWLVSDSIIQSKKQTEGELEIEIAIGKHAIYYHILDTEFIKYEESVANIPIKQTAPLPPFPKIDVSGSKAVGETLIFDATSSNDPDGTITNYVWEFGDGTRVTGSVAQHVFSQPGQYAVTLVIRDNDGLSSVSKLIIAIR